MHKEGGGAAHCTRREVGGARRPKFTTTIVRLENVIRMKVILLLLGCLGGIGIAAAAQRPPVLGWIWPRVGSLAGGTTVNVYGNSFAIDGYTSYNLILLGDVPCIVIQYTSSPTRLQCVTEPYPHAQEGTTYSPFQSSLLSDGTLISSTGSHNQFTYHWTYTPQMRSILPSSGPVSSLVALGGSRFSGNLDHYESLMLGNSVCETRRKEDNGRYGFSFLNSLRYINCRSTEQRAGAWNGSLVLQGASGRTWNHSQALYPVHDWSLAMYELFPDIHEVLPQLGSVKGGTLVTVTGTGFQVDALDDVAVDIDGIPCRVLSASPTEVRCLTGAPSSSSPAIADENMSYPETEEGYRFRGSRGVNYMQYDNILGGDVASLHRNRKYPEEPDFLNVYPSFSTAPTLRRRGSNYGARFTAFFNPRASGQHTFYATSDDQGEVWFAQGNNISEVTKIISNPIASGFHNFYRRPEQKADAMFLSEEEDYLIAAEYKEGGGDDYMQVGVLMHETNFTFSETQQVVREKQQVELYTTGQFQVQRITVQLNLSEMVESSPPMFLVAWGGREASPVSLQQLGTLNSTLFALLNGVCEGAFGQEFGFYHHNDHIYGFEDATTPWLGWNGPVPQRTLDEAFCGRQALYIENGRARAPVPHPDQEENGVRVSVYPYLCLAYKLPHGHTMSLSLHIRGRDYSISFSSNQDSPFSLLASFWDYSRETHAQDDNQWHFSCTDIETMLGSTLNLIQDPSNDENTVQSMIVDGLGFYSTHGSREGFYVDEVSFSSELRTFHEQHYLPPARPGGPIYDIPMEVMSSNESDVLSLTYLLTIHPATCQSYVPLITVSLLDQENTPSVLEVEVDVHQQASVPIGGSYTLSFGHSATTPLNHDASPSEIQAALESLDNINRVTVSNPQALAHDTLQRFCPGRRFQVQFEDSRGDLPLLGINSSYLVGSGLRVTIEEVAAGGLFLRPIPGHMLQTVEVTPQVHVRIRGQLAACSGTHELYADVPRSDFRDACGFKYGPRGTPVAISVTPDQAVTGDLITIRGTGFSEVLSENYVVFGDVECEVTSSTATTIECTLGSGFAGFRRLYLHVLYSGVAEVRGDLGITYSLSVDSVSPPRGSGAGGTMVTITGSGFYRTRTMSNSTLSQLERERVYGGVDTTNSDCSSSWRNEVLIGGTVCNIVDSTSTSMTVETPAEANGNFLTHDLEVSVVCPDRLNISLTATLLDAYTYDASLTPSITSIDPSTGSILGGQIVSINGSGFSVSVSDNQVLFGDTECAVTMASETLIACVTPPHVQDQVEVSVVVSGKGKALGSALFDYSIQISSISHCSGSILGGQLISITGSGFGRNTSSVDINLGQNPCEVMSVANEEILCRTSSISQRHQVDNNVEHEEYGLGYRWNPSSLTIHIGDTVHWRWTGSPFTTRRGVAEVSGPEDMEYSGEGFRSQQAVTGSYSHTFTKPGTYHYITEGYSHIGFRGTIEVIEMEDTEVPLSLSINSISLNISDSSIQCTQSGSPFHAYTYSASATPVLQSISQQNAVVGDRLALQVKGISSTASNNFLLFGGNTNITCSSPSPPILATTYQQSSIPTAVTSYSDVTVECTVPNLPAGMYRLVLHVAGRGWGHATLEDTVLTVNPRVTSAPSIPGGSLRGGVSLAMNTEGLLESDVLRTRVRIGNTPCRVEGISSDGVLTCFTQPAVDDGYSSLVMASQPLAYWNFQADYFTPNGSYLVTDGLSFFRSGGSLAAQANASVHGRISRQETGISGNNKTDQSIQLTEAAFLQVPALEDLVSSDGFAMEFWMKIAPDWSPHYRVVINASSSCTTAACGIIVVLNPCNQLEYWMASGESATGDAPMATLQPFSEDYLMEVEASGESASGELLGSSASGNGQASGESSIDMPTECPLVRDSSQCPGSCSGHYRITRDSSLPFPTGLWHVLRGSHLNASVWYHVYTTWRPSATETNSIVASGTQEMAVNGELSSKTSSYLQSEGRIEIGGTSSFPLRANIWSGLTPFRGHLDEMAVYDKPLEQSEIQNRLQYGTQDMQPIWLSVEGFDGVGTGPMPYVKYPDPFPATSSVVINWESQTDMEIAYEDPIILQFEWTMSHGVRQVSRSVYESCDLEADYIEQWAPNVGPGKVSVPLQAGGTYYFIDSVVGGCTNGRKLLIRVGNVRVIEWRLDMEYPDLVIPEGTGLLFRWSGSYHNLLEMSSPTGNDCNFVNSDAFLLGQVRSGWLKEPASSGEIAVSGLSVGDHYFACSVGDHCLRGMRFRVTVEAGTGEELSQESEVSTELMHSVNWRIRYYDDMTITEGDAITFVWDGFHSLHQVTEHVYESCNTSAIPLHVWADQSVDNSAVVENLTPGTYYFICSVAGHCSAGMKVKVIVLPDDGLPALVDPVIADCAENAGCYFSYSASPVHTPQLSRVDPMTVQAGSTLTLYGVGLVPPTAMPGPVSSVDVWLGNTLCSNVMAINSSEAETVLTCTVPTSYESDFYHVDVHVEGKGFASVSPTLLHPGDIRNSTHLAGSASPYPHVFLQGVVNSIAPSRGSISGGTLVTITGSGFSVASERVAVQVGNVPCDIVSSSLTEVSCVTGPSPNSAVDSPVNLEATVNGNSVMITQTYTYSTDATPTISSLSTQHGVGGELLTITGTNFGVQPRVKVISSLEDLGNPDDDCSVQGASTDTEITCTLPAKPAGTYRVLVVVETLGFARADMDGGDTITYTLSVDDFSPRSGGYGGGLVLTVSGYGFPTLSPDSSPADENELSITLCDTPCAILASNLSTLSCILTSNTGQQSTDSTLSCNLTITSGYDIAATSNEAFTFADILTPRLSSITPEIGGTAGGTLVSLMGSGFFPPGVTTGDQLTARDVVVRIDGSVCEWESTSITDTQISCRTGMHRTTLQAQVEVTVRGKGNAVSDGDPILFEYIDLWSSRFTWGGGDLPGHGDSVHIRSGQTVFLDISPPELNLLLIEGALIFSDTSDLNLQAKYIFVNNGTFQVGTEDDPFEHRATITLHGNISDPEIPIYGAKVLGVRQGHLDLHGRPRHVTWTRLAETAETNATSITLQQPVDWEPGDKIVIAPTGKNGNETEEHEISSVSSDNRTIELTTPLNFTHHGITEILEDGNFIEMRAEVGLLSHNVIVEGAIEGQREDQYGAQIFIHRMGPHPTPIRLEHVEVRQSGQAFRLGRYSIHFHLSGSMNGSYVRHCSIHHSFNRAITAHGVHDLLIEGNVAYDIMGHAYFVEDGVETNNMYLYNLGVLTRSSSSLLNTDQIPATFWITNPQNTFIGNAAAASRAYGFWYDLDNHPSGASFTRSVCPNKAPFGEFRNNTAHTCNEFGLRIWETYIPFRDGCGATEHVEATLHDFTTYGNGIHGVELSVVGHVRLSEFRVADNVANGIEIQETLGEWGGPQVINSLIVSRTSINNDAPQTGGIKTPNTPRLTISNITFANFNDSSTSCLRACSHCKTFQGGFEVHFQQLRFIGGSEQHKTAFKWEFEVLYLDLDGSLTGQQGGGWVVPDSALNPTPQCRLSVPEFSGNSSSFNGSVCTSEVGFLRMAWNHAEPRATLMGVGVNVSNEFGSTVVPWRHYRLTHLDGYMFTMPDGYSHAITWLLPVDSRVDTTSYSAGVYGVSPESRLWISHEFVMLPDHVRVGTNNMITDHGQPPTNTDENFSWFINNQTDIVTYLISGANLTAEDNNVTFIYSYEPCPPGGCPPPGIDYGPYESRQRRWSDPNSWPSNTLPGEGEDVTISSRWRMLLDISPPPLASVYIFGELTFENTRDYNFTANLILVHGPNAHLIIGTAASPFTHQATVTLTGRREDDSFVLARNIVVGSKAIGIFGNVTIHGVRVPSTWSRLTTSARTGSDVIQLPQGDTVGWSPGDQVVIAPSGYDPMESEIRTIAGISQGTVTLTETLEHDHLIHSFLEPSDLDLGDPPSESSPWWGNGGAMAPEVGLLTHNIVIQGGEDPEQPLEHEHYGCRILVGKYTTRGFTLTGHLKMDSAEVRFCGQGGYFSPRDPRYSIAFRNNFENSSGSYVRCSSVHHGYNTAIGVHTSSGVEVSGNVIWRTTDSSVKIGGSLNVFRNNLAMMTTTVQPNRPLDSHAVDFPATFDIDSGNTAHGNAAAGSTRLGFQYGGESCLERNTSPIGEAAQFWDNTAHSGLVGLNVLGLPEDCTAIGGFTSMYQWNYGVFSSTASSLLATHLKIATGKVGLNLNVFGPNPVAHHVGNKFIRVADSLIVGNLPGETCTTDDPDFRVRGGVSFALNDHKLGIMMSSFNQRRSKMDGTGAWHLMKGYPVIDGVLNTTRISFARFTSALACSYGVFAVGNNPLSPDAVHPMQMTGTSKYNVDLNSLAFFYEPDPEWIVQEDCVDMDCDGPKHALIRDLDGQFVSTHPSEGSVVPFAELRFSNYSSRLPRTWFAFESFASGMMLTDPYQLVQGMGIARGNTSNLESEFGGCVLMEAWQAYRCKRLQHHMLVIESMDADTETRRLSPLALEGGDTGAGEYTDLINGPMDHGWCTYYTCLKRLSTFFTIVAVGSDYCVWMTGSPPNTLRFHLLNAGPQDALKICIWFKSTQRKDVYKNGVFIEPENVRYLDGGSILQTADSCEGGSCIPTRARFGGANYFDRESQVMHMIIKGSDPVEIRTPPVVQVSLSLAVSLDDFFDIGELINNLAFVLKIDKSRIRVVKIASEDPTRRFRRSLLATSVNHTSITLEFGNPPAPNITMTPPPSVADEIEMAREINDSVDLEENSVPEVPLNGSNPLNVDPPETTDFVETFNVSAIGYIEEVVEYQEILEEVEETNTVGEQLVNLVLTGSTENITNATILGLSVVPALPPPPPQPPVIPPAFQNISDEEGGDVIVPLDPVTIPPLNSEPNNATGSSDGSTPINFVIPSSMRVTMEPQTQTGHIIHVAVTIFDNNDEPVRNLGLVNPWMCEATLVVPAASQNGVPELGGETSVPFVRGVAEFTRLRVDRPGKELTLLFHTDPTRFNTATSVRFTVVAPSPDTPRVRLGFILQGDLEHLPENSMAVTNSIKTGLGSQLDIDISRIDSITYQVTADGIVVEFDLLEKHAADPPDVKSLADATTFVEQIVTDNQLTLSINGQTYSAIPGSFETVTLAPPTQVTTPDFPFLYVVVIAGVGGLACMLGMVIAFLICYSCCERTSKKKGRKSGRVSPAATTTVNDGNEPRRGELDSHSQGSVSVANFIADQDSLNGDCWLVPSPPTGSLASLVSEERPVNSVPSMYHHHYSAQASATERSHPFTSISQLANPSGFDCLHSRPSSNRLQMKPRVSWAQPEDT